MAGSGDLKAAFAHHQAGRLGQAESLYRRILAAHPGHADALHLLGLLAHQSGHDEPAQGLIEKAIRADPQQPAFHVNLAIVYQALGRAPAAEAACRRALALDPGNAEGMNVLGLALGDQGKTDEAEAILRQVIEIAPDNAAAHNNLGRLLRQKGRPEQAMAAYGRAIEADPKLATAHGGRGVLLRQMGRFDEAEAACRRAVGLAPGDADAQVNLGNVLRERHDLKGAEASYTQALSLNPDHLNAHLNLGGVLDLMERTEDSLHAFRRALGMDPGCAAAHNGMGLTLLNAGRTEEAGRAFGAAIEADGDFVEAYYNLGGARHARFEAPALAHLEGLLARPEMPDEERMKLHFILARHAEEVGQRKAAFAHCRTSNQIRRLGLARAGHVFDGAAHGRLMEAIAATCGADFFAQRQDFGLPTEKPVFIVGAPRSGTTLVEQIAASHSRVYGAGELPWIPALVAEMGGAAGRAAFYADRLAALKAPEIAARAGAHLEKLSALGGSAQRVIDKMPFNYQNLGLIALMFPQARIIHCRRDPLDTGLSCYFNLFTDPLAWTTDLADIGLFLKAYQGLMDHWRGTLPLRLLEVDYEALVGDTEGQSRAIIQFLGLHWEEGCLAFHDSRRMVRTAAKWQVRQPVYSASVGRAGLYAKELAPLAAVLAKG